MSTFKDTSLSDDFETWWKRHAHNIDIGRASARKKDIAFAAWCASQTRTFKDFKELVDAFEERERNE